MVEAVIDRRAAAPSLFAHAILTSTLRAVAVGAASVLLYVLFPATEPPHNPPAWQIRVAMGIIYHLLAVSSIVSLLAGCLGSAVPLISLWVGFGIAATGLAKTGTISFQLGLLAVAAGLEVYFLGCSARAATLLERRDLAAVLVWAIAIGGLSVMVLVSGPLSQAWRQFTFWAFSAVVLLNPLFVAMLGALMLSVIRGLQRRNIDPAKLAFALALLLLAANPWLPHKGRGPAVPYRGANLQPYVVARFLLTIALGLYVGTRRDARRTLIVASLCLVLAAGLLLCSREGASILLLTFSGLLVGMAAWGLRRTLAVAAVLATMLYLSAWAIRPYYSIPYKRICQTIAEPQGELARVYTAAATSGWTGISGAYLPSISRAATSDYAPVVVVVNYGKLGLWEMLALFAIGVALLVRGAVASPDRLGRFVALSAIGVVAAQWVVPLWPWQEYCPSGVCPGESPGVMRSF